MPVWGCICLTAWLSGCASESVVAVEVRPLLPPEAYLEPCEVSLGDGTIGGALQGLRGAVECERADKAALRAWREKHIDDDGD